MHFAAQRPLCRYGGVRSSVVAAAPRRAFAASTHRPLCAAQRQQQQQQQQQQQRLRMRAQAAPPPHDPSSNDEAADNAEDEQQPEQQQPEQPEQQPRPLSPSAKGLYRLLKGSGQPQRPGAEHGEGFSSYLPAGGVMRVDVEALNESLRTHGALRLRHAMRPDEAFGVVLNFDGAVADMRAVRRAAWRALADARRLPLPDAALAHPELHAMPPEVAAVRLLRWAGSQAGGRELAMEHAALAARALAEQAAPRAGAREWLDALARFNVPAALVSSLDKSAVRAALARMALHDHFTAVVSAEDELDTPAQRLLSASVKLARAPNMCVAVETTPAGVAAAHNASMKAIALAGPDYPAYRLRTADLTCRSLAELTVQNIRRLFANRGCEFMDAQLQVDREQWKGDDNDRRRRRRRLGIATSGP